MLLKDTALRVRELLRSSDGAARLGGEKFSILLSETRIEAAMAIAEAVRGKSANVPFERVGTVSASLGAKRATAPPVQRPLNRSISAVLTGADDDWVPRETDTCERGAG